MSTIPPLPISYPESSGFLVSGAMPGRLSGHRILLLQDFCGKTMETVTEQPIKKIEFFRCPQSLPGVAPLTKKPEDSGYEIAPLQKGITCTVRPSKSSVEVQIVCHSRTSIKRHHIKWLLSINQSVVRVPKITSLN